MINQPSLVREDVKLGKGTVVRAFTNLYGCEIGENCSIGTFVEIQDNVKIGNGVRINSHSFLCSLVTIEDNVFLGHGVMTINDLHPPSRQRTGKTDEWKSTLIKKGAVIGSNATLLPVTIGEYAVVGAGSVVTRDVEPYSIVVGNPARHVSYNEIAPGFREYQEKRKI